MKRKFLSIILSIMFAAVLFASVSKTENKTSAAYTANEQTYTIKNETTGFSVSVGTGGTVVESAAATIEAAIEVVATHSANSVTEILFDSVVLESQAKISLNKNYLLTGSISAKNNSAIISINNPSSISPLSITFKDFVLSNEVDVSTSYNLVEVEESSNPVVIVLDEVDFNHSVTTNTGVETNTHSIFFKSTNHTINLKNTISHTTEYLYNFEEGINLSVDEATFFVDQATGDPLADNTVLMISIPYDARESLIYSGVSSTNGTHFGATALYDFYEVKVSRGETSMVATSTLSFVFDTNSANFNQGYTAPEDFFFVSEAALDTIFPTAENMSYDHHYFDGWFGKISYQSQTYYFDQETLSDFVSHGIIESNIPLYFKTSLDEFDISNSFEAYRYLSKSTASETAEYLSVYTFAELNVSPTYIAKWNINTHTITYIDSANGETIDSQTYDYNEDLTAIASPTRTGYTFTGWFTDAAATSSVFDFTNAKMPDLNLTVYAGWSINSYQITYITNNSQTIAPQTFEYGAEIVLDDTDLTQTEYEFVGWFEYLGGTLQTEEFSLETMPDRNIELRAVWTIKRVTITFDTKGGTTFEDITVDYNGKVSKPANPTKSGYTFAGWFYNYDCTSGQEVVFDSENQLTLTKDTVIFANWLVHQFSLEFYPNNGSGKIVSYYNFKDTIEIPTINYENHTFIGWFADENCTTEFKLTTMPDSNVSAYAKWKAKPLPEIDVSAQTYIADALDPSFVEYSKITGFTVKYFVDGEWTFEPPTKIGSYDVMISRSEDDRYARFSQVVEDGFVINPVKGNYAWIGIVLLIVAVLEFVVAFIVKKLRKMKTNMIVSSVVFGIIAVPISQIVFISISAVVFLAGLVCMIYQFVKLNKTVPIDLVNPRDESTRMEKLFAHTEKLANETTAKEYSAADIEDLLINDTVGQSIKDKNKLHELEPVEEKPVEEPVEDDEEDDGDLKAVVEIVDDNEIQIDENEKERLYNSEDPFVRKDPNDYTDN